MTHDQILSKLPYSEPFLFVDEIIDINENGAIGTFLFRETLDFYKGHFAGNPVTPGVILTECMAQIGLVCLGVFLLQDDVNSGLSIAMTSSEIEFLKPVYPQEQVEVRSRKKYFRFGKLKCEVEMRNGSGELVCSGTIAGILTQKK